MYRAEIQYTIGLGLDKVTTKCDNYSEMNERVNEWIEKNLNRTIKVLGRVTVLKIERVVFTYPSGKKFVKKFA